MVRCIWLFHVHIIMLQLQTIVATTIVWSTRQWYHVWLFIIMYVSYGSKLWQWWISVPGVSEWITLDEIASRWWMMGNIVPGLPITGVINDGYQMFLMIINLRLLSYRYSHSELRYHAVACSFFTLQLTLPSPTEMVAAWVQPWMIAWFAITTQYPKSKFEALRVHGAVDRYRGWWYTMSLISSIFIHHFESFNTVLTSLMINIMANCL